MGVRLSDVERSLHTQIDSAAESSESIQLQVVEELRKVFAENTTVLMEGIQKIMIQQQEEDVAMIRRDLLRQIEQGEQRVMNRLRSTNRDLATELRELIQGVKEKKPGRLVGQKIYQTSVGNSP